jgi:hypothetical protein
MAVTLDLPPDLEAQLNSEAAHRGLTPADYIVQLVRTATSAATSAEDHTLPEETEPPTSGAWPEDEPRPTTGAELIEYWKRHGLIGTRPDIKDSVEYVRKMRRKAETRDWS